MVPSYPSSSEKRSKEIAAGQAKPDGSVDQVDEGRKLFAHFLWSAAMVVAEGVEEADRPTAPGETETEARKETRELWSIKDGTRIGRTVYTVHLNAETLKLIH